MCGIKDEIKKRKKVQKERRGKEKRGGKNEARSLACWL